MTKQPSETLNEAELAQFTGTEFWYRHSLNRNVTYTDGAKYVAETGGAYWLLDEIALTQLSEPAVARQSLQVWTLSVRENHTATLACEDGNHNQVYSKPIEFTDFPLDTITLWFSNNVILLPSEW